jgi:hypothetical protein
MSEAVFRYKNNPSSLNPAEMSIISANEIMNMTSQEFLNFKGRLANVRHRTRFDTAVWEAAIITPAMVATIFRKGVGQTDKYASSDTTFNKTRAHTNMTRNGEFPQGSLVIVADVIARKAFTSGVPTTVVNGVITNPRATFPAYLDPALALQVWTENVEMAYREDDVDKVADTLNRFPQNDGMSGAIGASQGGIMQNVMMPRFGLHSPRVLDGGDDFSVEIRPLANFDASVTGINQVIIQRVELETVEVIGERP